MSSHYVPEKTHALKTETTSILKQNTRTVFKNGNWILQNLML